MLEQGLVALLTANAALTALIGTRLYPVQGPPDNPVFPYITYQDVTASSEYNLDSTETRKTLIQFDIWGTSYLTGKIIANALRNALSGYQGTLTDGTRVLFARRGNYLDNFDVDSRTYRSIAEWEFTAVEP